MWNFLKNVFMFRLSQDAARNVARSLGAGAKLAGLVGLLFGVRQWRARRHA
jgi:hypothetical protein